MLFSEDITPLKLLEEPRDLKHSRTLRTGLEHGPLKDKACTMEVKQCRNQEKTLHTLPLLTLVALSYLFPQMYSRR